jgi:hypothetical protein
MKVCDRVSSWATQQLAEQQTVSCSSCMLPTVHQGATTARHRSDPCSSRHMKCRVNLSNLGTRGRAPVSTTHKTHAMLDAGWDTPALHHAGGHPTHQQSLRYAAPAAQQRPQPAAGDAPDPSPPQRSALQQQAPSSLRRPDLSRARSDTLLPVNKSCHQVAA